MPSHSVDGHHAARFGRQEAGQSTYLIPWLDGRPVGHAEMRGVGAMGLGVGDGNPRAAALYARLGYLPAVAYLDRWTHLDSDGVPHDRADPCTFRVKAL
ncbi:hypothetical protein ACIRD9_38685 [Streptomyces violaceus]|uniref:hypothetical protein n=1 Tax=Streptomyces violaceus TaxID=1936 RepID=UPI0038257BBD